MSASPEFYKPAAPAFSPPCAAVQLSPTSSDYDYDYYASSSCRTPTGSGIAYLREPTTCPSAPRKPPPPPCRKRRLFQSHAGEGSHHKNLQPTTAEAPVPVISLRLDELERLFRPHPPPTTNTSDKRRRSARKHNLDTQS